MDNKLLNTCSNSVQKALKYIDDEVNDEADSLLSESFALRALDHVKYDKANKYLDNYVLRDQGINIYEFLPTIVYFAKIYNNNRNDSWSKHEYLSYAKNIIESVQMERGDFSVTSYTPGGAIWFLSQEDPSASAVKNGIRYLLENEVDDNSSYLHRIENNAVNALCLIELGNEKYSTAISNILSNVVEDTRSQLDSEEYPVSDNVISYSLIIIALSSFQECNYNIVDELVNELKKVQHEDGRFDNELAATGAGTLALIHTGEGPKIPIVDMDNMLKKKENKIEKSKARFVATIPSTRHESRVTSISDNMERMIENADHSLLISTLRIDYLYEPIIDKMADRDDFEVKVVTNTSNVSGEGKKLKEATMSDLIKRTEGNVKEDKLIHARMVVADKSELIVSTADLTREQLVQEYNVGIYTENEQAIQSATELFNVMWERADHKNA
jgi:hypothetical protein